MTNPVITVDVSGALARLHAVAAAAQDLSPVFSGPINQDLDQVFKDQFDTEGAAYGTKWRKLAPATLALRQRRGHGRGGILRDTNVLWASFTKLGLGPDAIKKVGTHSLVRGSTVPYGRWHQTGYMSKTFVVTRGKGSKTTFVALRRKEPVHIPARPIIPDPMPAKVINRWVSMIEEFITTQRA